VKHATPELKVESEVEKGTTFTTQLPVLEGEQRGREHGAKGRRQRARSRGQDNAR